jgi:3',5'-cyclic-AMP phosphodiesterase
LNDIITLNHKEDNVDRRGFLRCMAWAGTGMIWTISGGVPNSRLLADDAKESTGDFSFVQISDSHLGFNKPANPDVSATLQAAIDRINALPRQPDFLIHTGDLTHMAKPAEFDSTAQLLSGLKAKQVFYVPGEHDTAGDDGKEYLSRFGKDTMGSGWYSYDHRGVHFIGLVNVMALEGMGKLGAEQLEWVKKDLAGKSSSTPIVVFAHIPLWTVYPDWGWGTQDSEQLLGILKRFGSVTVLNGHIHQVMQKVEGSVTFHTAMSTAFPQPAPGKAAAPGPMKVPAEQLRKVLGITGVDFVSKNRSLAVVDSPLSGGPKAA